MDGFSLFSLVWPMLALLLGALEIGISLMLLKEEGVGPKLMLGGAVAGLLGNLGSFAVPFLWEWLVGNNPVELPYVVMWSLTGLGSTLFTLGLLLYVLRRRALATRIAELEAILDSRSRN